jgi:hypothetical protein
LFLGAISSVSFDVVGGGAVVVEGKNEEKNEERRRGRENALVVMEGLETGCVRVGTIH